MKNINKIMFVLVFIASLLMVGCDKYDPNTYSYFNQLKQAHISILDGFNVDSNNYYRNCSKWRKIYTESNDYNTAKNSNDELRFKAYKYLYNHYINDSTALSTLKSPLNTSEDSLMRSKIIENYDLAITGELKRKGSPFNKIF